MCSGGTIIPTGRTPAQWERDERRATDWTELERNAGIDGGRRAQPGRLRALRALALRWPRLRAWRPRRWHPEESPLRHEPEAVRADPVPSVESREGVLDRGAACG